MPINSVLHRNTLDANKSQQDDDDITTSAPNLPKFPDGFCWGLSTASYQIEGSPKVDGKGKSI